MMAAPTAPQALPGGARLLRRGREHGQNQAPGTLARVPGVFERMECCGGGGALWVVVDDAHSPVALEKTLTDPRLRNRRRVINVAACGGDRDQGKRPLVGLKVLRPSDALEAHLSDRAQVVEAPRKRRDGNH